jgi:L-seryl-tRNA(Ser) seleniumtransferase
MARCCCAAPCIWRARITNFFRNIFCREVRCLLFSDISRPWTVFCWNWKDKALAGLPRQLLKDLVAEFLDLCREEIRAGIVTDESLLSFATLAARAGAYVRTRSRPHFRRVINATGVVIHTNLGRSILADEAVAAVAQGCRHYSNLEMDLDTGQRGSRYSHVEKLLCRLTGAEAGLVVNNNAAAVLLVLDTLAKGREVVVSRGQLVEIGGSFRIPRS